MLEFRTFLHCLLKSLPTANDVIVSQLLVFVQVVQRRLKKRHVKGYDGKATYNP